jgi:hypothetical protein
MTNAQGDGWKDLCEAIMLEHDPARLMELVQRLNDTLDTREAELKRRRGERL